jgi:predicted Zn-ribbon and HTH transcriptional regulator
MSDESDATCEDYEYECLDCGEIWRSRARDPDPECPHCWSTWIEITEIETDDKA